MSQEPSMEEILSSIKRIIAEDSEVALSGQRGDVRGGGYAHAHDAERETEVEEGADTPGDAAIGQGSYVPGPTPHMPSAFLSEGLSTEVLVDRTAHHGHAPHQDEASVVSPVADPSDSASVLDLTEPHPSGASDSFLNPQPEPPLAATVHSEGSVLSAETARASRESLALLSALVVRGHDQGSLTLEGLVRDLLRPLLADWLDAHLPAIVERKVAQEIARLSAQEEY